MRQPATVASSAILFPTTRHLARRAGSCPLRPCRPRGADIRGWPHLPVSNATGYHVPRWQSAQRARRRAYSELREKGHPIIQQLLRDFVGAEAADDATVVARFVPNRARDVPLFAASLPIFSRDYYQTALRPRHP